MNSYKGYLTVSKDCPYIGSLYGEKQNNAYVNAFENEYLKVERCDGKGNDILVYRNGKFEQAVRRTINNGHTKKLTARNDEQVMAIDLLYNPEVTVKIVTGLAGSGKSLLTISAAMDLVRKGPFEKILYIRPNVEVADMPKIGTLPGGEDEKLRPFYQALGDHIGDIDSFNNDMFEFAFLGFMRGRDIKNSIILVSEAENLTVEHVEMLVERCGEGSELWLDGDTNQVDAAVYRARNGLDRTIDILKGDSLFGCVELNECERSKTARLGLKFKEALRKENK